MTPVEELYQSLVAVEPATLIVTILNLFLQMFLVKKFLLDKVLKVLDDRRKAADEQISAAEEAKAEAMAIKETYEENMRQAKAEAGELLTAARQTATAQSDAILSETRAQVAQMKEKAAADIAQEKKKAMNEAKDSIASLAMDIAAKVVEREVTPADHEALVGEFIEKIGEPT